LPFTVSNVARLPATRRRRTQDIKPHAPCSACSIRHAAVGARVATNEFQRLVSVASDRDVKKGQMVFGEGERGKFIYSVTDGTVMSYKLMSDGRRQITGFYFPGDFIGLVDDGVYANSAEAVTDARLFAYPLPALNAVLLKHPVMGNRLAEVARHELVEAEEHALLLGRKTAKEKIATFLIKLSRHAQDRGEKRDLLDLSMPRAAIADYLGLTTETTSRTLTGFAKAGLISSKTNKIRILDEEILHQIAEGFHSA
jgi:CRP/FNR family transcriptional regulator, anaerobic regulatory protein